MKFNLKTFFLYLLLICMPYSVFGADCEKTCTIKNAPAEELLDYIKDARKITSNVLGQVQESDTNQDLRKVNSQLIKIYNSYIFNWGGFFNSFEYNVLLPLRSEVPEEIRRDYRLIREAIDYQNNVLYKIARKGGIDTTIGDACAGLKNCNLKNGTAGEVMGQVIANTNKVLYIYRLSLVGSNQTGDLEIDFGENIREAITNKYSPTMISNCSNCEGEYGDRLSESIENIVKNNGGWNDGVKKWQEGVDLLLGRKSLSDQQETANLKQELIRQGVSQNTRDIVLQNLENAQNGEGTVLTNNFLVNSVINIRTSVNINNFDSFEESIDGNFRETGEETTNVNTFINTSGKVDRMQEIDTIVTNLYETMIPFSAPQNTASNSVVARVSNMHDALTSILKNSLNNQAIQTSQQACDKQHKGQGNCTNY